MSAYCQVLLSAMIFRLVSKTRCEQYPNFYVLNLNHQNVYNCSNSIDLSFHRFLRSSSQQA